MPTYDYQCDECEIITEDVIHPWDEQPVVKCPECNAGMRKMMPMPRLQTDTRFLGGREGQFERGHGFFSEQLNRTVYSKAHARQILREKGWGSESLGVKPVMSPPKEKYTVAPDIVEKEIKRQETVERGGVPFEKKKKAELNESLTEKLSGRK